MNVRKLICNTWVVLLACCSLSACRQSLKIKVELLEFPPAAATSEGVQSPQVTAYEDYCDKLFAGSVPVVVLQSEAARIKEWATDVAAESQVQSDKALLDSVQLVAQMEVESAADARAVIKAFKVINGGVRESISPDLRAQAVKIRESVRVNSVGASQYGGFVSQGIFMIDPASQLYRYVLDADEVDNALCDVEVSGWESSTIILVQESPGYFRLKQISSDPTRTLQNIGFIADMALRAAGVPLSVPAKSNGGGALAPPGNGG